MANKYKLTIYGIPIAHRCIVVASNFLVVYMLCGTVEVDVVGIGETIYRVEKSQMTEKIWERRREKEKDRKKSGRLF